jgi:hypothetical protein
VYFSAQSVQIKKAVGQLYIMNVRETHPFVEEVKQYGLNINEGMLVKFNHAFYQGAEALHFLALIGSNHDWFNRWNVFLFQSKTRAKIIYPILKGIRNIPMGNNQITEIIMLGLGVRMEYIFENQTVLLKQKGYVYKIGKQLIPLPFLSFFLGIVFIEKTALTNDAFQLKMRMQHFLLGKYYNYSGIFKFMRGL